MKTIPCFVCLALLTTLPRPLPAGPPSAAVASKPAGAIAFTSVVLRDVQGLFGGQDLWLSGDGRLVVQVVRMADRAKPCSRYTMQLDANQVAKVARLLGEHKFFEIEVLDRSGVPDEARPAITVRSATDKERTVRKWAGDKHADFDPVYAELLALVKSAQAGKPEYTGAYDRAWLPPAAAASQPGGAEAEKIDTSKSGTYTSGKWKCSYSITAQGTRSEGQYGKLWYDGRELSDGAGPSNNFYQTPWGKLYNTGQPNMPFGPHGWMPTPRGGCPEGKQLPDPGQGAPAGATAKLEATDADAGKILSASVGQKVILRVPSEGPGPRPPPRWTVKLDGNSLKQEGEILLKAHRVAGPGGVAGVQQGGPMTAEAVFSATTVGKTTITLEARPWREPNAAPSKTFTFTLDVKAPAAPTHPAATGQPAKITVKSSGNKEDRVAVSNEDGTTVITVISPSGIGAAVLLCEEGDWPRKIRVRLLHKEGSAYTILESFGASLARNGKECEPGVEHRQEKGPAGISVELTMPTRSGLPELQLDWINAFRR